MPAPWSPDATKDATLQALADNYTGSSEVIYAEKAWNLVRGQQSGFADPNEWDDLAYCRFNWYRFYTI